MCNLVFFFQAEDGIRDAQESRGLGDVYKRQRQDAACASVSPGCACPRYLCLPGFFVMVWTRWCACLLYTSDAADDLPCVDLGGRRIIKKKTT